MPKRILVIEDDSGYQELMRFVFSGYDLVVCGTVKEATEKIKAAPFDLIISDINLGGPSGLDFLEDWGKEGQTEKVPLILWSSQNDPDTRQKAVDLGAAGFITKPFNTEAVRKLVETLLK